jgi:hypothetical protein
VSRNHLSRRALLGYAPAATIATAVSPFFFKQPLLAESTDASLDSGLPDLRSSIRKAFAFQNFMMDAYAQGSTVRLTQSYSDQALGATAFTYDNAVAIHAYLASRDPALQARAVVLGEGLLYGQAHPYAFPIADGRFPQGFFVNTPATDGSGAYVTPAAGPYYFYSSTTGDQAWAGMALAQLYLHTRDTRFLNAALKVANWIVTNTYDTHGAGGYKFGTIIAYVNFQNVSQPSGNGKSTEHNIDTFAFFTMLRKLTGDAASAANGMTWSDLAQHALEFVKSMYNPDGPYFYTGTASAINESINYYPIPEDCQTWSYLAIHNHEYRGTIDWALQNLQTTDTASSPNSKLTGSETIRGMVFDSASLAPTISGADPHAVWLEGTGHTIAALAARVQRGGGDLGGIFQDIKTAADFVRQSILAQTELGAGQTAGGKPIPPGEGLVASTSVMDTGFGYTYGPSLHIGATGWYLLGALAANPFQLGYHMFGDQQNGDHGDQQNGR